jgi:hypothetical protein
MLNVSLLVILLATTLVTGCGFENTSNLLTPTAPSGNTGTGSSGGASNSAGATTTPASAFSGAWGSSSIAGLPVGNCTNVKWLITQQSATSIGGTMSATCAGGATVSATLNGQMSREDTLNLTAAGTIVALGIPCPFNLTGVGTRQTNDAMRLVYQGAHCLGNVSGTENLKRFPEV